MSRTRSAVSVSLFYAALFGAVGVQLPFWPIWLADRGLDAAQIGIALATPYLGRAIFSPLMGWVVDHLGQRQRPLLIIALLTTLLWTCFALVHSFGMILILGFFASGLWACMMPLGDIVALSAAAHWAFNYAHARLWGSISFIVATMGINSYANHFTQLFLGCNDLDARIVSAIRTQAMRHFWLTAMRAQGRLDRCDCKMGTTLIAACTGCSPLRYCHFSLLIL